MSLACKLLVPALLLVASACAAAPVLRVCADPGNLPYSNKRQQGFENRIAALIGKDLGEQVSYYWFPQEDSFFSQTLKKGVCDVVMSVPTGFAEADTTRPYYASSYVFLSRRSEHLGIRSFDDPRLKSLRIGVHYLDSAEDNLPPVFALASRGIVRNVVGYSIFGNSLAQSNPTAELVRAVANGQVDVAIMWGPSAGYFSLSSLVPLAIDPIESDPSHPGLQFTFPISIGVRRGQSKLKRRLDAELLRRHTEIVHMMQSYGIPEVRLASLPRSAMEN